MSQMYVTLPYDPTGNNPDNHVGSEKHLVTLYSGCPYGMVTLDNGGFYGKGLRVYDKDYNLLTLRTDYIITYHHKQLSDKLGLAVASTIVFLKPVYLNQLIYVSAQMVGGDVAFSFTAIEDYITFYKTKVAGYVPAYLDYVGTEPIWGPGELANRRWGLDMFQPYNMELENIAGAITQGPPELETEFRDDVKADFDAFKARFSTRLQDHIANKANPHVDQKRHVDLGNVVDLPVATAAISRTGTSNAHYLTPQQSWFTVDTFADVPLAAHTSKINQDPHGLTPAQVNAYPATNLTALINAKYTTSERVANAININLNGSFVPAATFISTGRQNLSTAFFSGMVRPALLGLGTPSFDTLLRGNRTWVSWESLVGEYVPVKATAIYRLAGAFTSSSAILAQVNALYGNITNFPVGTVVMATFRKQYTWGAGNGGWTNTVTHNRWCLRTAGGWIFTGLE